MRWVLLLMLWPIYGLAQDSTKNAKPLELYGGISAGLLASSGSDATGNGLNATLISGVQLHPHIDLGWGMGIQRHDIFVSPVFAHVRYNILKRNNTPYVDLRGGWVLPLTANNQSYFNYFGGPITQATVGWKLFINDHLNLFWEVGYRWQKYGYEYEEYNWWNADQPILNTTQYEMYRFDLNVGLGFN